ncbi:MAG: xanthine dehydrogenase family protein molybdopterin-binding subunit [Candidatus Auribacterota bacterium]|nr:xanthine dehydrogenase family protein molybdopterin-binding subunit [Candidatus Auribacterota bacterium]
MTVQYIGKDLARPDAFDKITGAATYLDDIRLPGLLYMAVLLPEHAHAKIHSIDVTEAERSPGVVKVVTGRDCPFRHGIDFRDRYPLAIDRVRHAGEPVAVVIAENARQARLATSKIRVKYEPLPVYIDGRASMRGGAVLIHPEIGPEEYPGDWNHIPGTNIVNHQVLKKGNLDQGVAAAGITVEGEFNYPFSVPGAIEPHGAIVWFKGNGTIEAWLSCIRPFMVRKMLAEIYHRPVSAVLVHVPEVGGCFGDKSGTHFVFTVAAAASRLPGHPVKWFATRKESFLCGSIGNGVRTHLKIGTDSGGKFTFFEGVIHHSVGACSDIGSGVMTAALANIPGPYEIPNYHLEGYCVYTNTPPVGALRGFGNQSAFFATERLMDMLARKLKMNPVRLREINFPRAGQGNHPRDLGDIAGCGAIVAGKLYSRPKPAGDEQYFYGRGFSVLRKTPGPTGFFGRGCYLKLNEDGSVTLNFGTVDMGGGHRNAMRQIAAEALLISPERITVSSDIDTQTSPWEWQTTGSVSVLLCGRAVVEAAGKAIELLKENASLVLGYPPDQLSYDGDQVFRTSDPMLRVPVAGLAHGFRDESERTIGGEIQTTANVQLDNRFLPDQDGGGQFESVFIFGAQGCELRIHKETGRVIIDHFISSFDVGQVINPRQIRGQVTGGVMMACGAALKEELKFDRLGKPLNPSFGRYGLPTISDAPLRQTIEFVETPLGIGPFGARPIGEGTVVGVAPAILNAIADATGIEFFDLPVTPDRIKAALKNVSG